MLGVPTLLSGALFGTTGSTPQIPQTELIPNAPVVIAFILVPSLWYLLNSTPFGLRLRAVGENPEAADTAGISVLRVRYTAVLVSGALAAIGGAYLSIGQSSLFTRNMTAGRGYIALAALIFGKWRPVQTMLACLLFGFAEAASIQMQGVTPYVRVEYIQIIPYVLTMVVLAGFIGASRAPKALGHAYRKER
jgi:simple sugar transport system permease protein